MAGTTDGGAAMRLFARASPGWSVSARIGLYTGPREANGCRNWTGALSDRGYAIMSTKDGGPNYVSRRILGLIVGDPRVAMHSCDNPSCVEPSHLSIGTKLTNHQDMTMKGRARHARGEMHGSAKLNDSIVREILGSTESARSWARRLGVASFTVDRIRRRQTWRHVT